MKKYFSLVLAVLVCGSVLLVVSAQNSNNPFAEDSDGDGLPNVVEMQVGTNPNDPYSCIYVQGVSDANVNSTNETKIEITE